MPRRLCPLSILSLGAIMHKLLLIWFLAGLLFLPGACRGGAGRTAGTVPTLERLPTVTPVRPTVPATPRPSATPFVTATPTPIPPTPTLLLTDDGPVTPSMAQLQLGGERYAALGDPAAPITLVEFADFGCSFCRIFALTTFADLRAEYIDSGKVYYVYKDLPVVSPRGDLAAQAAECAGEQGRYWELHQQLFLIDGAAWNDTPEAALATVRTAAAAVQLDPVALENCIVAGTYADDVRRDFEEAQALRIFGTPAFFINGKLLSGAQPIDLFREVLNAELAAQ